ncbi:hypothetical protein F8388_002861 [Cannabis sativa]|uniref:Alpha-carbonic anhydrase domain-containing protein n=1 Tax=Cannabis sativa TaxID=3483 RepID=A0A7J6FK01_CANSA|nr:hypothetical protein F8388_002861 [Cannabis sativa]
MQHKTNKGSKPFIYKLMQTHIFVSWVLLILISFYLHQKQVSAQEVEDESEFDYVNGSEKGPQHWGNLKEEWRECKHGKLQSPIDLLNLRVKVLPKFGNILMNYKPANATIRNRGHDIAVVWVGDAGSAKINGINYLLKQCHWHSPSEHSFNGRRFELELHMVHESHEVNGETKIAVTALFYRIGKPDRFLTKLRLGGFKYYRYIGSLTVPPCTQGVLWAINKRISTVSREQVRLLRVAVHDQIKLWLIENTNLRRGMQDHYSL